MLRYFYAENRDVMRSSGSFLLPVFGIIHLDDDDPENPSASACQQAHVVG